MGDRIAEMRAKFEKMSLNESPAKSAPAAPKATPGSVSNRIAALQQNLNDESKSNGSAPPSPQKMKEGFIPSTFTSSPPKKVEPTNPVVPKDMQSVKERMAALQSASASEPKAAPEPVMTGRASIRVADLGSQLNLDHIFKQGPPPKFGKRDEERADASEEEVVAPKKTNLPRNPLFDAADLRNVNLKKAEPIAKPSEERGAAAAALIEAMEEQKRKLKKAGEIVIHRDD